MFNFNNLTFIEGAGLWYCSGLLAIIFIFLWKNYFLKREIIVTVQDFVLAVLAATFGPLLWLIPIGKLFIDLTENYDRVKHKTLWKNRRAKNKDILFGNENDIDGF